MAALFHDIGKANEDFFNAVSQSGYTQQTLRHEHISTLVLHLPEVRSWLATNPLLDLEVITAAVLSHHLKAASSGDYKFCQPRSLKKVVKLYLRHLEITSILKRIAAIAQLESLPTLTLEAWKAGSVWEQAYKSANKSANKFGRKLKEPETRERRSLLLATKAGLIVADAAASGLVREGHSIDEWIDNVVHSQAIGRHDIDEAILQKRAEQIADRTGEPFRLHTFQIQTAQQGSKALLLAACAAGKTIAGWKWAEAQSWEYEIGKVIFLYPTRGTATEGFRDYVGWSPETDAALVTGTARYELEAMAANPSDEATKGKDFQADERLFALGFWSRRYFSATVDQFLGFMEHSYTSMCLLPVLADSVVIIDEVHSFDRKMFDSLVSFLQNFDVPVLCMTATLPPSRRVELEEAGLKVYSTAADREDLAVQAKEDHPRYRLEPVANASAAFERAVSAYQQGERVLWVVNTVDRCQTIARKLAAEFSIDSLTYHSRYRLQDRQIIHNATVDAFAYQKERKAAIARSAAPKAIAITTQVCEMSLDLDADVLITEIAPISSLVQRFGRANRHLSRGLDFRAKLHIYQPPKSLPYKQEELEAAKAFLEKLGSRDVSQQLMAEALEEYALAERSSDGSSRFLEGGYFAIPGDFRDTEEFAVPCILDQDLDAVEALIKLRKPYDGFKINVPHKWADFSNSKPKWLPKYLGVASWERYDPKRGFLTKEDVELG